MYLLWSVQYCKSCDSWHFNSTSLVEDAHLSATFLLTWICFPLNINAGCFSIILCNRSTFHIYDRIYLSRRFVWYVCVEVKNFSDFHTSLCIVHPYLKFSHLKAAVKNFEMWAHNIREICWQIFFTLFFSRKQTNIQKKLIQTDSG